MPRAFVIRDVLLCLLLIVGRDLSAQNREQHLVAFYNVENLFDTINNPATLDEDMLPLADRGWNSERYNRKIDMLARVIADMQCCNSLPAIVGLAEVENREVLESLTHHSALAEAQYQICHFDSPDRRGIDVALLYCPDLFCVAGAKAIPIKVEGEEEFSTRDVLVAWGEFCGERFMFVVVHWPSRIGGVAATEHRRVACARRVREILDAAMRQAPDMKIVVMGDMNDNPSNRSLRRYLRSRKSSRGLQLDELYNPFPRLTPAGSSRYDGRWNHYDNILFSPNLVVGTPAYCGGLCFNPRRQSHSASIFCRDYMCDDRGYPLPTYSGSDYVGGASDHLPVCVILRR